MPTVSVLIADRGDRPARTNELVREIEERQTDTPREVLVEVQGTVAEARNLLVRRAKGDILVFIDTDMAPGRSDWLTKLTGPILKGAASFTCGPSYIADDRHTLKWSRWHERSWAETYERCSRDETYFPSGNSAWSRDVFRYIGLYDEQFGRGGIGGEDYDLNLRAVAVGLRGMLVQDAWVYHDLSDQNTAFAIFRKMVKYAYGGALVYFKNGKGGMPEPIRTYLHSLIDSRKGLLGYVKFAVQTWAYIAGGIAWKMKGKDHDTRS